MALPSSAMAEAQFSIDEYRITGNLPNSATSPAGPQTDPISGPADLQAGVNPTVGSFSSFSWAGHLGTTDDVKTAVVNFGPGLLGNPLATPQCPQDVLAAGGKNCPAGSEIGTSRFDIGAAALGTTAASLQGKLYNSVPDAGKPGQLATITITSSAGYALDPPAAGSYSYLPIPFEVTERGGGDYGLTGTTGDITRPVLAGPTDGVATGLSFLANSSSGFVRNPTSCVTNRSTGFAVGYENPEQVDGPPYYFTPTGCSNVQFAPSMSMEIGKTGENQINGYPPMTVKIKNQSGHADIRGTVILLPIELNANNTAYKLCTQAQADANACPANSQFGTAEAASPFLSQTLKGPVYLIQQTSSSLPGLLLDLNGLAHVKIQTDSYLGAENKQIVSVVNDAPQLPVSELTVALTGGKTTGVFQNRSDLCFEDDSSSKFRTYSDVFGFDGWNGAFTGGKYSAKVLGCGAGVSGKLTRAQTSKPRLSLTVNKHPDASNIKTLDVTLPKGMRTVRSRFSRATARYSATASKTQFRRISARRLRITSLPAAGTSKITIVLRNGALRLTKSKIRSLNRGRTLNFKVKAADTPVTGSKVSTTATVSVKGKRR